MSVQKSRLQHTCDPTWAQNPWFCQTHSRAHRPEVPGTAAGKATVQKQTEQKVGKQRQHFPQHHKGSIQLKKKEYNPKFLLEDWL